MKNAIGGLGLVRSVSEPDGQVSQHWLTDQCVVSANACKQVTALVGLVGKHNGQVSKPASQANERAFA